MTPEISSKQQYYRPVLKLNAEEVITFVFLNGYKTVWEEEKMLATSIFIFPSISKRLISWDC